MSKKKQSDLNAWKPLALDGSVFSGGIDGLIGVEELTNYKLEKESNTTKIVICDAGDETRKCKVSTKRKSSNKWQEDNIHDNKSVLKKAKFKNNKDNDLKRKKKKKVSNQIVQNDLDCNSDDQLCSQNNDIESIDSINVQAWSTLGVPDIIIKALKDQQFHSPTTIQMLTLPPAILGHRDILGAAETGSGKTLAFGIPIINGILELKSKQINEPNINSKKKSSNNIINKGWICAESETVEDDNSSLESDYEENDDTRNSINCVRVINNVEMNEPQNYIQKPLYALILTPTRELAVQIKDHLTKAAKYTDIKIAIVLGGMAEVKQQRILSKGPEIVIATPGRLWELIQTGNPHLNQVDSIKYLAIDETDRMLEKGHFQELQQLLEKINMNENMLQKRQTFVFSATLTMVHDIPQYLQKKKRNRSKSRISKMTSDQKLQKIIDLIGIKNPKIVDITKESGTASSLTECRIVCTIDHKDYYLYYFLKRYTGRTLVFCNSIGCVKRLATLFGILDCRPLPLHASMQQRQRLKNLERFQVDEDGLLIATDVAARGLDIPNVEHVIHYQVPRTSESYVHRSGRTARAQREGITVLMMEPSEKQYYTKLCKTLDRTEDLPVFPVVDKLLIAVKERVNIARDIDKLELKSRRNNSQKGWLRKAVEDMELVLEEDEEDLELETKEMADLKRQLKMKKRQLDSLLSKPLFPKGYSGKYFNNNIEFKLADTTEKAVDIMKKVIKEFPRKQKEKNKLLNKKKTFSKNNILKKKTVKKA
ncbi:ATP-dependent RNA helicase DDX24 [Nomia melanderi]|uniref:ATP-dependent RNA helicase DDX24 n=1 Tax=Nomia melanderi TaxID=2448451 RepID=UPI003FCE198E